MSVDASGRVLIPKDLCEKLYWITGTEEITVWLLIGTFGRCRVLSQPDIGADADFTELVKKTSTRNVPLAPLEFDSEADAMLGYRVFESRITHSLSAGRSAWRLKLPSAIVSLWGLRPPTNEVAIRLWAGYLELWEINALKSSCRFPLVDFL